MIMSNKRKIGIITKYYNNNNYGGIAQAYALQRYIDSIGLESELVCYDSKNTHQFDCIESKKEFASSIIRGLFMRICNRMAWVLYSRAINPYLHKREEAFSRSREKCVHSKKVYSNESIRLLVDYYDFFIVGSDQVWHPNVIGPGYVCDFYNESIRCISYASSISSQQLSPKYVNYIREKLQSFKWISVREISAQVFLTRVLERQIDLVVDPVFLLKKLDWDGIASSRIIEYRYIFVYLLGQSKRQRSIIRQIARDLELPIVFLPHIEGKIRLCDICFADEELYDVELSDFLSLIKNAEIVITDSYHGSLFSIIFKRNFWVLERKNVGSNYNMNSRLDTLLKCTGLYHRVLTTNTLVHGRTPIDFNEVWKALYPEIEKSKELLKRSIYENY